MFCTQCGRPAQPEHVFCAGCGSRLARGETVPPMTGFVPATESVPVVQPATPAPEPWTGEDWRETTNYRVVLAHPQVKELIANASKASKAGMTAEEFMKIAEPILKASGTTVVPIKLIAEIATPMAERLGLKTGKEARNGYSTPFGRVLAAILCSFASRNQRLVAVHEGTDGCVVEAELPSTMTTWTGKLSLTIERKPEGTLVTSAATFGQASDWGRAKRVLDELHQDILNYRTLQP